MGIVAVFVRPAGRLDRAVQRDMFDDPDLSHSASVADFPRMVVTR